VKNHFGEATIARPAGKLIWVHAASIGESIAAITFINHIKGQFPDLNVLLTTITVTSADILQTKIKKTTNCHHQFCVADNLSWVNKFLDYWKMDAVVFMESEIWPNTIDALHKRNIPTYLLNARLSAKSFGRWKMVGGFFSAVLQKFTKILAQSELDGKRFAFFSPANTICMDNLKYANAILPCDDNLLLIFRKMCSGKKVFVAASTHEKEENTILEAHKKLKKEFDLVTIIIPRHLTRLKRVCDVIKDHGFAFSLRSEIGVHFGDSIPPAESLPEIFCVDTFGEVGTFFRLADICFVGGSLVPIGGHNIYEPVALGKPVLHGPFMDNALEISNFLGKNGLAFEVKNATDICEICSRLLQSDDLLKNISKKALAITKNDSLRKINEFMHLEEVLSQIT
jgi:3-deoxy-D-manno-octulosonic-acid transferase